MEEQMDSNKEHASNRLLMKLFLEYKEESSLAWQQASDYGWFPNSQTSSEFKKYIKHGQVAFDEYMMNDLRPRTDIIHEELIQKYSERRHIFDVAFSLHNSENYIGAMPLFLAQIDGICAQEIGRFLFNNHDVRIEKIKAVIEEIPEKEIPLAPLIKNTLFGANIRQTKFKNCAPNRNGILHGSRKHLDYGTELNSLKCISLLSYIADVFRK